jgi:hypothetical protein
MSCFCSISSMSSATACRLNEPCSQDSRGKRYAWKRLSLASSSQTTTRGNPRTVGNREVIRGARHVGPYREVGFSSANLTLTRCAFIATNPEALLPHSIASTPPLGANLLTPNSLRRARGTRAWELGLRTCFRSAASNGGAQHQRGYRPAWLEEGPSSFDGGSKIEIPGINHLVQEADVRSHRPMASAHL